LLTKAMYLSKAATPEVAEALERKTTTIK